MRIVSSYPIVITPELEACRAFYTRLGFEVVFEATWFLLLSSGPASIAFMSPEHPSAPPRPGTYAGDGMFFTLQVDDAKSEYEAVVAEGMAIAHPLTDEKWGQRRFALVDPAGMWVDVVEQTAPEDGFWEPYLR